MREMNLAGTYRAANSFSVRKVISWQAAASISRGSFGRLSQGMTSCRPLVIRGLSVNAVQFLGPNFPLRTKCKREFRASGLDQRAAGRQTPPRLSDLRNSSGRGQGRDAGAV